ncbi:MAG TPA: isochorismatase family protein [Candidatus Dormibacteraeota bacterium]|nr:isochorismatase family protein [Candidatus Dormibacteraeota bacterium]
MLAVPHGDGIFSAANTVARRAPIVVASRDWHPSDHISFRSRGGIWLPHCQQGTDGAEFHPALDRSLVQEVFSKGSDPDREAYSAFDGTDLAGWLRERGVRRLLVAGLATDYCVRASVLDALGAGFDVTVLRDGIGAVDVKPGDGDRALEEMREAGARVVDSTELSG